MKLRKIENSFFLHSYRRDGTAPCRHRTQFKGLILQNSPFCPPNALPSPVLSPGPTSAGSDTFPLSYPLTHTLFVSQTLRPFVRSELPTNTFRRPCLSELSSSGSIVAPFPWPTLFESASCLLYCSRLRHSLFLCPHNVHHDARTITTPYCPEQATI